MKRHNILSPYLWVMVFTGALICVWCLARLLTHPGVELDRSFIALVLLTLIVGPRLIIQIPQGNGELSITDTLIFLIFLLYGGEAATLVATTEAIYSKTKNNKKIITFLFAGAVMACSTFASTLLFRWLWGPETLLANEGLTARFIIGVSILALTQFFSNTVLVAAGAALKNNQSFWHVWSHYYLWSSITYIAGALAAGITVSLMRSFGTATVLVFSPVIIIVYFTYRMYFKNIEASVAQADQARRHAVELQSSEERFHGAFDYAPIGIALLERDGKFRQVNRAWRDLSQSHGIESFSGNLRDLLHPQDVGPCFQYLQSVHHGATPPPPLELRLIKLGGAMLWGLLSASALHDADAGTDYLVIQIQDITVRKNAEETLRQSEQLKSALLDAVTHDLRTPLTSIKASVTTLLSEFEETCEQLTLPSEVRQELLEVIDEEADRLNCVISGHVGLARLENGSLGLHRFHTEIHDVVNMARARVAGITRGHKVEWQLDEDLDPVQVDAHAVAEVLFSLLDNAAKHTPLQTTIKLRGWQTEPDYVHLAVEDSGQGIPLLMRERVFEKFFRLPTPNTAPHGTGLGLAISRGIIEAHGGRIWIEDSTLGRGARVVFTLPVSEGLPLSS